MELRLPCNKKGEDVTFCSIPIEKEGKFTEEIARRHPQGKAQYTIRYFDPRSLKFVKTTFLMNVENYQTLNQAIYANEELARRHIPRLSNRQKPDIVSAESADSFLLGLKDEAQKLLKLAERAVGKSGHVGGGSVAARPHPTTVHAASATAAAPITPHAEGWIHNFDKPLTLTFRVRVRRPDRTFVEMDKFISLAAVPGIDFELYKRVAHQVGDRYYKVAVETAPIGDPERRLVIFLLTKEQKDEMDRMAYNVGILSQESDSPAVSIFEARSFSPNGNGKEYISRGILQLPNENSEQRYSLR